jgi:hypothetical protein
VITATVQTRGRAALSTLVAARRGVWGVVRALRPDDWFLVQYFWYGNVRKNHTKSRK